MNKFSPPHHSPLVDITNKKFTQLFRNLFRPPLPTVLEIATMQNNF